MPYNLRRRYNLRDRPSTIQGGRTVKRNPKPRKKGVRRGRRRQGDSDTPSSLAETSRGQQQDQPSPTSAYDKIHYDQMHPWFKAMGYELGPFIPDPENGLKEGEEPPHLVIDEDADPDGPEYDQRPWPDLGITIDPVFRETAKNDPFVDAWMRGWDRMHRPKPGKENEKS